MGSDITALPYGKFPSTYQRARLAELCVTDGGVQTGPFGSQLHRRDYVSIGTPIITVEHIGENRIIHQDLPKVSDEDRERLSRYSLQDGDIVFSRVGSVDLRALVRKEESGWLFSGRLLRVRPKPDIIDSCYLSWFFGLPSFREYVRRIAYGATMPSLNTKLLSDLPVYFPSVGEQKAIAHILGSLDDKIELNRKMNETLEAMARAIFKSWFVDFVPVRAKAEGRAPGLPKEIADLFPDSFEDSELGEIPKGWDVVTLGDIAEVIDCLHSKKPERRESGWPLLQLWNICGDGLIDMAETYYIGESDYKNWVSRMEASPGDCVITNVGRVGAVAQIPESLRAALGRNMTGLRCKSQFHFPTFLIECLISRAMCDEIVRKMDTGTILDALNVRNIPKLRLVLPPLALLIKFEGSARPLRAKMEHNLTEARNLVAIRDTLLPKLISGEIRIKDTEKFITVETAQSEQSTDAIYTIGHSNHSIKGFITLLKRHAITAVADVRSSPFSRLHPQFNQAAIAAALKKVGIAYVFLGEELGARPKDNDCYVNGAANFEKMAERLVFKRGIDRLLTGRDKYRIALLCAEKEPLECHRTILVCHYLRRLVLPIRHILADGSIEEHQETERRLVNALGLDNSIFDADLSYSERIEKAYKQQASKIAYKPTGNEENHGHTK